MLSSMEKKSAKKGECYAKIKKYKKNLCFRR